MMYFTSNGVPLRNVFIVILSDLIRFTSGRANCEKVNPSKFFKN